MKSVAETRVLVVGTGALGSLLAARLAASGTARVAIAGTWTEALAAIRERGILLTRDGFTMSVPVDSVALTAGGYGPTPFSVDLALVAVKSHQTDAVAGAVAGALDPLGIAVTLQNGLGNRDKLAAVVGDDRTVQGITAVGATLLGPGSVLAAGSGATVLAAPVRAGRAPGAGEEVVVSAAPDPVWAAARLLTAAGIPTTVEDDVDALVWRKLAASCAINPLSALLGVENGRLLECPATRETMSAAAQEVGAVAVALGIDIGVDPADEAFGVARATAANRSSMLQDVSRGAPTEIEAINGAVVRVGRRLGVAVPVNESLTERVRRLEVEVRGAAGSTNTAAESTRPSAAESTPLSAAESTPPSAAETTPPAAAETTPPGAADLAAARGA